MIKSDSTQLVTVVQHVSVTLVHYFLKSKKQSLTNDLFVTSVLSGNRNFEGRVHPLVKANYLASPPLVVAYALSWYCRYRLQKDPIGKDKDGNEVFFTDIWPTTEEVNEVVKRSSYS